jgi:SAM-dependent methyltransferase
MTKSLMHKLTPDFAIDYYRRFNRYREQQKNLRRTTEDVFTEIYQKNKWGGVSGDFYSGTGTTDQQAVAAYTSMVSAQADHENFRGLAFVDLGCGDFRVGKQLLPLCSSYTGIDIVQPLILRNQAEYGNSTTKFLHLDIIQDDLPAGDVCFIRQVLQHLSNQQISTVLQKLKQYNWVFITEHYPTDNDSIQPNIDKVQGCDIRVYYNSGVYLTKPPFQIPSQSLRQVLEVPGSEPISANESGIIRTYLYKPNESHGSVDLANVKST